MGLQFLTVTYWPGLRKSCNSHVLSIFYENFFLCLSSSYNFTMIVLRSCYGNSILFKHGQGYSDTVINDKMKIHICTHLIFDKSVENTPEVLWLGYKNWATVNFPIFFICCALYENTFKDKIPNFLATNKNRNPTRYTCERIGKLP